MDTASDPPDRMIFTIGHSNHSLETFLALLQRHTVEIVVDTRSQPVSSYSPHFNRESLQRALDALGIRYVFQGEGLGGRPQESTYYDDNGHVLYSEVAKSSRFLESIRKLEQGAQRHRLALLCSEENPSVCHRKLLVSRVLHIHV